MKTKYTQNCHDINFTDWWLYNFEIRVGGSEELGDNDICHKQFEVVDSVLTNITCSPELYGDWVSINKTEILPAKAALALIEIQIFGSKYTWNSEQAQKILSLLIMLALCSLQTQTENIKITVNVSVWLLWIRMISLVSLFFKHIWYIYNWMCLSVTILLSYTI